MGIINSKFYITHMFFGSRYKIILFYSDALITQTNDAPKKRSKYLRKKRSQLNNLINPMLINSIGKGVALED